MYYIALRMLVHDKAKYFGLVFAIGFSSFMIAHQASIFSSIMARTTSQIMDMTDVEVWVMDPKTQNFDEVKPMSEQELYRVRSVEGVKWAVRLYKANVRAKTNDGRYRTTIVLGLDDPTLAGAPKKMLAGKLSDLQAPDTIIMDRASYGYLFPGQPLELGGTLEFNDRRVKIVGICDASPPFQTLPVTYAKYTTALNFAGKERSTMSFLLVRQTDGVTPKQLSERIQKQTGLKALPSADFGWMTIWYYIRNTGIPVNFGITVTVAIIVGTVVSGQTFYIFTLENIRQFGALKAIGFSDWKIAKMVILQASVVGFCGLGLGLAMAALFFLLTKDVSHLRGFILRWQTLVGTCGLITVIVLAATALSLRKLVKLEPAIVFRG